jgi:hypothetical protein
MRARENSGNQGQQQDDLDAHVVAFAFPSRIERFSARTIPAALRPRLVNNR